MLTLRDAALASPSGLTTVELKVLVYELREREEHLASTAQALRRGARYRDARKVEADRRHLERERKEAERRLKATDEGAV